MFPFPGRGTGKDEKEKLEIGRPIGSFLEKQSLLKNFKTTLSKAS
jgi:hypothetical protein